MRVAVLLLLIAADVAAQPAPPPRPRPPADACGRAAFRELERVQARATALAAAGLPTQDDIVALVMDVPTSYVMQSPGRGRFLELFATSDARVSRKLLGEIAADFVKILGNDRTWAYRCEAYPSWHIAPPKLSARELARRGAIAKRTKAALVRADECAKLTGRVLAAPEHERHRFTAMLHRCYRDLNAARARCERDFDLIAHSDGYGPFRAQGAVSNILELRRKRLPTTADVLALRRRILPMLDALQPPLSELTGPTRAALTRNDPIEALYELSGALKVLVAPCGGLWPSQPRCIVTPQSCEKRID